MVLALNVLARVLFERNARIAALLRFVPDVGLAFLLMSVGIAFGAAVGRYHYTADVILGAALAVAVSILQTFFA